MNLNNPRLPKSLKQGKPKKPAARVLNVSRTRDGQMPRSFPSRNQSSSYYIDQPRMGRSNLVSGEQAANSLQLHSPQLGHSTSVFFESRKGSTPGGMILAGRELSATAISATSNVGAYVNTALNVNCAGTNLTARWATFATLYQKWRIRALRATLVSNQSTTTVGNLYAAFQTLYPVPAGQVPATGAQLMRENGAVFGNAYSDLVTEFDARSQSVPWFSTSTGAGATNTNCPGVLNIGSDGFSAAVVPGTVVVDYEIEFADPI